MERARAIELVEFIIENYEKFHLTETQRDAIASVVMRVVSRSAFSSAQPITVWSYGGGTQSIALAILVRDGSLAKPDKIVFADTGREATETFEYTDRWVKPILAEVGMQIEVAGHELATVDL